MGQEKGMQGVEAVKLIHCSTGLWSGRVPHLVPPARWGERSSSGRRVCNGRV